jgi:hypothetical protein
MTIVKPLAGITETKQRYLFFKNSRPTKVMLDNEISDGILPFKVMVQVVLLTTNNISI